MKKIFLVLLVVLGVAFAGGVVFADNAVLLASPASATNNVASNFSVSVKINPAGNKVCVVKGTLVLTNLTCKSISVASGLMAQTTPTCASPSFTLGIPGCTTALKNLLTVSVSGKSAGSASLTFSGAKVIGSGVNVAFASQSGTYTITAVQPKTIVPPTPTTSTNTPTQPVITQTTTPAQPVATTNQTAGLATSGLVTNDTLASASSISLANFMNSPILIVVVVIILILLTMWLAEKFIAHKKK